MFRLPEKGFKAVEKVLKNQYLVSECAKSLLNSLTI